jgi:cellulose synthase/poly-beta-1,6-N-acetylglucosamine synthase-like glycosyltransferase
VTLLLALFVAPFTLLTLSFALEVFVGLRPLRPQPPPATQHVNAVIIVPAHNEETGLAARLKALKDAAGEHRILVIADNCEDSTADIARSIGAEVVERSDPEHRGKGFALDFARSHLEADPPQVIVIIDADCAMDRESIDTLVTSCAATARPCQATNLQSPVSGASLAVQLSTFAFFIKNVIRQRALQRLAGRAHLLGTGMAFPWAIFEQARLATANIVEDLKLGQELAELGYAPLFIERATVWSSAETDRNTLSQRRRWEGGFLQNALSTGPAMFVRNLANGDVRGLFAAANLMIPPFALLIMLDLVAVLLGAAIVALTGADRSPVALLGASLVLAGFALTLGWSAGGSRFVSLGGLARAPLYLAWKLPLYLGFARRGAPKEWIRTERGEL